MFVILKWMEKKKKKRKKEKRKVNTNIAAAGT